MKKDPGQDAPTVNARQCEYQMADAAMPHAPAPSTAMMPPPPSPMMPPPPMPSEKMMHHEKMKPFQKAHNQFNVAKTSLKIGGARGRP